MDGHIRLAALRTIFIGSQSAQHGQLHIALRMGEAESALTILELKVAMITWIAVPVLAGMPLHKVLCLPMVYMTSL